MLVGRLVARSRAMQSAMAASILRLLLPLLSRHPLSVMVKVAEAAIAMAEHQAFAAYDPVVGSELLRAFVEAHKAAKDANQS